MSSLKSSGKNSIGNTRKLYTLVEGHFPALITSAYRRY
jgi:hypothetical protein